MNTTVEVHPRTHPPFVGTVVGISASGYVWIKALGKLWLINPERITNEEKR